MERWAGRVALVTGASKGIGRAVAKVLVKHGMKVAACARTNALLEELSNEVKEYPGSILPLECDLSDEGQIKAMFERIKVAWGGVDVCINNAGVCIDSWIINGDSSAWKKMVDINIMALCHCSQEAYKSMEERKVQDAHIININSLGGHRVGKAHFYSATKFAVTALTEGIRWELRGVKSKVKISEISPGLVKTHFHDEMMGSREKALDLYNSRSGLEGDDVACTVVFLLSTPPHVQVHEVMMRHTEQEV